MILIAHRGASWDAPENTVSAVRLAWEQQADGVEIDVRLTSDQRVVVIHDEDALRTTGHGIPVRDLTSDDLEPLDAGLWKGPKWQGEHIPFLEEILNEIPSDRELMLDIKCGSEIIPYLKNILDRAAVPTLMVGAELDVLKIVCRELPSCPVYWNVHYMRQRQDDIGGWSESLDRVIETAVAASFRGLGLEMERIPRPEEARAIHDAGLEIFAWTVDDADTAGALADIGVDRLATNRPEWIREQLKGSG